MSTKNGTQWTGITACRNIFYIFKKGPQTPCDSFGMMVWLALDLECLYDSNGMV